MKYMMRERVEIIKNWVRNESVRIKLQMYNNQYALIINNNVSTISNILI